MRWRLAAVVSGLALVANSSNAFGQSVGPGDIVATRGSAILDIFHRDTGVSETWGTGFSSGFTPSGISLMPNGDIVLADSGLPRVVQIDIIGRTIRADLLPALLQDPVDIALDPAGDLLVADASSAAVVKILVDPSGVITTATALVSIGNLITSPRQVAVGDDGRIFLLQGSEILAIDPVTAAQVVLASGSMIQNAHDLLLGADGQLVLSSSDGPDDPIVRVYVNTGMQEVVSSGNLLDWPYRLAIADDGTLIAEVTIGGIDRLVQINQSTGQQTLLEFGGELEDFSPLHMIIYPGAVNIDQDLDGILDAADNCPMMENGAQVDLDNDGVGDACDNCPVTRNFDQADSGGFDISSADGVGDVCQRGDLNEDGKIDIADDALLRRTLVNLPPGFEPSVPPNP